MTKKEIIQFGYNYAHDCGKETSTKDVLNLMYNLLCEKDSLFKKMFKDSKILYQKGAYGDLCLNPFTEKSKQYKYFTEGVLKAAEEMVEHNDSLDNTCFEGWCFDSEISASYDYRKAVESIFDKKLKKKCEALLKKYDDGISASMELVKLIANSANAEYEVYDGDVKELKKRLK